MNKFIRILLYCFVTSLPITASEQQLFLKPVKNAPTTDGRRTLEYAIQIGQIKGQYCFLGDSFTKKGHLLLPIKTDGPLVYAKITQKEEAMTFALKAPIYCCSTLDIVGTKTVAKWTFEKDPSDVTSNMIVNSLYVLAISWLQNDTGALEQLRLDQNSLVIPLALDGMMVPYAHMTKNLSSVNGFKQKKFEKFWRKNA